MSKEWSERDGCNFRFTTGSRCMSYAFNLHQDGIDQGDFCDRHYWQERGEFWQKRANFFASQLRGCAQTMAEHANALATMAANVDSMLEANK